MKAMKILALIAGEDSTSRFSWIDMFPRRKMSGLALKSVGMIVVLVAYGEQTAIPDILLAEHFLKARDADLPGDSSLCECSMAILPD